VKRKEAKLKKVRQKRADEATALKPVSAEAEAKMRAELASALAEMCAKSADVSQAAAAAAAQSSTGSGMQRNGGDGSDEGADDWVEHESEDSEDVRRSREEAEEGEVAPEHVLEAFQKLGLSTSTEQLALYRRAFAREKLIQKMMPKDAKHRRRCFIHKRPPEKDENEPLVVATDDDPWSKHHKDLMMSRSICDWSKCAWVLPHPQLLELTVGAAEHQRVVIASDGLWDVVSEAEAMQIARDTPSVDQVADTLMGMAKAEYLTNRGLAKMGDDTTVMVVDLNPSNVSFEARATATDNCCAIL